MSKRQAYACSLILCLLSTVNCGRSSDSVANVKKQAEPSKISRDREEDEAQADNSDNSPEAVAKPNTHFMVISGGGSPSSNHYSQFLQTRLISADLQRRSKDRSIDVHFAAGNSDGKQSEIFDVHRVLTLDSGLKVSTVIPGVIPANKPATLTRVKESFGAISEATASKELDSFFLVVTDHGMPNPNSILRSYANNCIDMWSFDPIIRDSEDSKRCLSVVDLRKYLQNSVRAKHKVFAMSQCYSGGFHRLSVNPDRRYPTADTTICGFTSTSWDETASGCTPDVSHLSYKGYERYFAQRLTGRDVITDAPLDHGKALSFASAHHAAAIEDDAKDIPMSTSDFYLLAWADRLEESKFKPRTSSETSDVIRALYKDSVDLTLEDFTSRNFSSDLIKNAVNEKLEYIEATRKIIQRVDSKNYRWSTRKYSLQNDRIETADESLAKIIAGVHKSIAKYQKIRFELAYTPWSEKLDTEPEQIDAPLLKKWEPEIGVHHVDIESGLGSVLDEVINLMAVTAPLKPEEARDLGNYAASREKSILDWARLRADDAQKEQLIEAEALRSEANRKIGEILQYHLHIDLLRRIVLKKREIATLIALEKMNDSIALDEFRNLEECQKTPLPE